MYARAARRPFFVAPAPAGMKPLPGTLYNIARELPLHAQG